MNFSSKVFLLEKRRINKNPSSKKRAGVIIILGEKNIVECIIR